MMSFRDVLHALFIPRGRAGRSELLVVAGVLLGLQLSLAGVDIAGLNVPDVANYAVTTLVGWVGLVATIRRLHDIGYSAWWVPGALCALCIWSVGVALLAVMIFGAGAIRPEQTTYIFILGVLMLPLLGLTLWLHLSGSDPLPNRFGAPTSEPGPQPSLPEAAASDMKLT
jgi:uncharacterized membrane protein YhaH (DUF805 family)